MELVPSEKEFVRLAKKGNAIPVYAEVGADLETPVSAFLKIAKGPYGFLLESVEQGEHLGRYSFLGGSALNILEGTDEKRDPFERLKRALEPFRFVPLAGLPRFCGGLVGYLGYDIIRRIEKLPDPFEDHKKFPDYLFLLVDRFLIFDHLKRSIKIVVVARVNGNPRTAYRRAQKEVLELLSRLKKPLQKTEPMTLVSDEESVRLQSNMSRSLFEQKVRRAKEYIRRGDIIQVVLSQQFTTEIRQTPFQIYRALRSINPSPYMFYLKAGEIVLVGSSPEMFVQCEDRVVRTRPIAGTRPRGATPEEDQLLERQLLANEKERAEHVMLVDLGRNDIGRVSEAGTVRLSQSMKVERYSHVMHIVSEVTGRLRKDCDLIHLIKATFPAGTVTGAPKIRAMQIIDELETVRRGPYAGCVGYLSFSGDLDSAITIRTLCIRGKTAYLSAGAGIVADSKPLAEYRETVNKAKALIRALST